MTNHAQPEIREASEDMAGADFAALDFEPWIHEPDEWKPPTRQEWMDAENPHLANVRLAFIALHKSKSELIQAAGGLYECDMLQATLDGFQDSIGFFQVFVEILSAAKARLCCAAMNIEDAA